MWVRRQVGVFVVCGQQIPGFSCRGTINLDISQKVSKSKLFKYPFLYAVLFCGFLLFRACHAFLSVHCSLLVTCCERANLLVLLYVMFSCAFITFPYGVLGQQ